MGDSASALRSRPPAATLPRFAGREPSAMASGHCGFPPPLTCGGDPAAPGNFAQGLKALSPREPAREG